MDFQFETGAESPQVLLFNILHFRIKSTVLDNIETRQIISQKSLYLNLFFWTNSCPWENFAQILDKTLNQLIYWEGDNLLTKFYLLPDTELWVYKMVVHTIYMWNKKDNMWHLEIKGLKITPTGGQKY